MNQFYDLLFLELFSYCYIFSNEEQEILRICIMFPFREHKLLYINITYNVYFLLNKYVIFPSSTNL